MSFNSWYSKSIKEAQERNKPKPKPESGVWIEEWDGTGDPVSVGGVRSFTDSSDVDITQLSADYEDDSDWEVI